MSVAVGSTPKLRLADSPDGAPREVVIILGGNSFDLIRAYAEQLPEARIHVLLVRNIPVGEWGDLPSNVRMTFCANIGVRIEHLLNLPALDLIVENGNHKKGQKLACLKELFGFLRSGGEYIVENLPAVHNRKLDDYPGENVLEFVMRMVGIRAIPESKRGSLDRDDLEFAEAIEEVTVAADCLKVVRRGAHLRKLRDGRTNGILQVTHPQRFEVITELPGVEVPIKANLEGWGQPPVWTKMQKIDLPVRTLRRYDKVVCYPHQIVRLEDTLTPDTFRHPQQHRLIHRDLGFLSAAHASLGTFADNRSRKVSGHYFHFDTEYPGHFGHVTTEVLSRVWGWDIARQRQPGIKPILSLDEGMEGMLDFQRRIFEAVGIPTDEVEYIRYDECVEVESLWAAAPSFAMPHYIDPDIRDVWRRFTDHFVQDDLAGQPERIFISRGPGGVRVCRNGDEVERFFRKHGFVIVRPEELDLAEQVRLFAGARIVAGYGGSGMFGTMHAPNAHVIIVTSEAYTANNEWLIANVLSQNISYVWGESKIKHPDPGWSWQAFQSEFTVDIKAHRRQLARLFKSIG